MWRWVRGGREEGAMVGELEREEVDEAELEVADGKGNGVVRIWRSEERRVPVLLELWGRHGDH